MAFTPEQKRTARADQRAGLGMPAMAVLRAIQGDEHYPKALAVAAVAHCSGSAVPALMAKLVRDGFIVRSRGGACYLTDRGRAQLPASQPTFARGVYRAEPAPPRRAGSNHQHIPSLLGSQLICAQP